MSKFIALILALVLLFGVMAVGLAMGNKDLSLAMDGIKMVAGSGFGLAFMARFAS